MRRMHLNVLAVTAVIFALPPVGRAKSVALARRELDTIGTGQWSCLYPAAGYRVGDQDRRHPCLLYQLSVDFHTG